MTGNTHSEAGVIRPESFVKYGGGKQKKVAKMVPTGGDLRHYGFAYQNNRYDGCEAKFGLLL